MLDILKLNDDGFKELRDLLARRTGFDLKGYREQVLEIVENVRRTGDMALREYTRRFDGVNICPQDLPVKEDEIIEAFERVDTDYLKAIEEAIKRIKKYHETQKVNSWTLTERDGVIMGQLSRPLEKVGVYVPGGRANYPSSVLMTVLPAKIAGVEEVIMVTPPDTKGRVNPHILVAARMAGVDRIFKVGGAQAIAALAYGSETIPQVDKIVGPGNIYVSLAKQLVYGLVDIDMIAGPSEILIIADETANPRYVAADLLSQAEHDPLAASILITTSDKLAEEVISEVKKQLQKLPRRSIIEASLKNYGRIFIAENIEIALKAANIVAPEHLELAVDRPFELLAKIKNAGAIFLGEFAPEPLGDYLAGPNHVLPTNGTARFFSPLSVRDFVKFSSFLSYSEEALYQVKDQIIKLAEVEGLKGHANAISVRFSKEG